MVSDFLFLVLNVDLSCLWLEMDVNVLTEFFVVGRETPSVAGIINPGAEGFQKLFFGQEEIAIPVHSRYVTAL